MRLIWVVFKTVVTEIVTKMLWSLRFSTVKSFFIFLQFFSITSRGNGRFFVLVLLLSLVIF